MKTKEIDMEGFELIKNITVYKGRLRLYIQKSSIYLTRGVLEALDADHIHFWINYENPQVLVVKTERDSNSYETGFKNGKGFGGKRLHESIRSIAGPYRIYEGVRTERGVLFDFTKGGVE